MAGIVFSKPQNDLARKSAVPDITISELQRWAEDQKKMILEHEQINENNSALLVRLGVDHTNLNFGKLGGLSLSYAEFIETAQSFFSLIIHDDEVAHDDDDDVLRRDFDKYFEADESLLELASQPIPDWLEQIDDGTIDRSLWSLDAALESALKVAWGEIDWQENSDMVVGSVHGTEISRSCRSAYKHIDISDL